MTKLLKVCVVSDGLPPNCGGAPLRAFRHAQRLQQTEDVETLLIAWDRYSNESSTNSLPGNVYPVRLRFQEIEGGKTLIGVVKLSLRLAELSARVGFLLFMHRREFDLLHVINGASLFNLMAVPIAKLLGKPAILETVGLGGDDPLTLSRRSGNRERQLFPHRPLKYRLFLQADAYVSKSPAISQSYRQAGLQNVKLFQIPNGVDLAKFSPPTPSEHRTLRNKLDLDAKQSIILFVGALNEYKGVHHLLAAFREIALRHPNSKLLLVGPSLPQDASYVAALKQRINDWKLTERVLLIDRMVDNIHEFMKVSDLFCLPTEREGFPGVIIEAMASGLPVVVSRLEGITTRIVKTADEGVLVPKGDELSLVESISELLGDPARRARLGEAARQRVQLDFTQEAVDKQYLHLYRQISSNEAISKYSPNTVAETRLPGDQYVDQSHE